MTNLPLLLLNTVVLAVGFFFTLSTFLAALRTFVLPRADRVWLTNWVFIGWRQGFNLLTRKANTYEERDRLMAYYAPMALLSLPVVWLTFTTLGYTAMFWAAGVRPLYDAFWLSGSSLLTLGFRNVDTFFQMLLSFSEATLGLILVAMLISYLPTMYSAFSRRELAVNMLEVRAGSPPSAEEMIARFTRLNRLERLNDLWYTWEEWFVEIEETHTSLAALVFFRSPDHRRSWVTAAGTVLDAAALTISAVDVPHDVQADICIRAGFIALRRIADFFNITYDKTPDPADPISIQREEFDELCERWEAQGVPLKPDRDQAWRDYTGWRVNYDTVLLALANLTMAPYAPWTSDRSSVYYLYRKNNDRG